MDIYDNSSEISSIARASPMIMFLIGMPSKRYVHYYIIHSSKVSRHTDRKNVYKMLESDSDKSLLYNI